MDKSRTFSIRYNEKEIQELKAKAENEGLRLGTYIRHVSLKSLINE